MARKIEEFREHTKKVVESTGRKWEELGEEQQDLAIALSIKVYYEANPEEAREILGDDDNSE